MNWKTATTKEKIEMVMNQEADIIDDVFSDTQLFNLIPKPVRDIFLEQLNSCYYLNCWQVEKLYKIDKDFINIYYKLLANTFLGPIYNDDCTDDFYYNFIIPNLKDILQDDTIMYFFIKHNKRINKEILKELIIIYKSYKEHSIKLIDKLKELASEYGLENTVEFLIHI